MPTSTIGSHRNPPPQAVVSPYRAMRASHSPVLKLHGKVALVNARDMAMASVIAWEFSQEGARVAVCNAADAAQARTLRSRINAAGRVCLVATDVCDGRDSCRRMVEGVVAHLGALDIVVNCGSAERHPDLDQIARIEATFRSSAFDYLYLMAAALPYLPAGASIINSCSLDAADGSDDPARAAAESAIAALTQSFADAAACRGVRVNAVARSPAARGHEPRGVADAANARTSADGTGDGTGSGMAAACLFLASVDSSHITGQIFHINLGGILDGKA